MKNTKEIKTILATLYCLNRVTAKDDDVEKILNYAFERILSTSPRLMAFACIGKTKEDIMPELEMLLGSETKYLDYKKLLESFNEEGEQDGGR